VEVFYRVVSLLGGLALFLYGMRVMGDGLKSSSGGVMKAALARVTTKPVMGFLLGLIVTCIIQSSTATIVLTVGLVGAGFLTFRQSIGIVLGANVGTSITAQIIRLMDVNADESSILFFFKSDNLAPLALIIGIVFIMFIKSRSASSIGTICMGFGILFVGLMNMSAAVSTMSGTLSKLLVSFGDNYFLGFLSGVLVTGIIQSSSAVVGILQSIASSIGVTFCEVFAVIIGVNIGDCLTTYLVCRIGAKPDQIRTCLVHVIYNICAALLLTVALFVLRSTGILSDDFWNMTMNSGGVANVHGAFRLIPAVLLLPFTGAFARLAEKIVPDTPEDIEDSKYEESLRKLDMRLIANPRLALNESEELIGNMAEIAIHNFDAAMKQLYEFESARENRIAQREGILDRMTDEANQYIVAVSPYITLESDRRTQNFQLKSLVCFERIGDLALNVNENVANLRDAGKQFSQMAQDEMRIAMGAVKDILDLTEAAFTSGDIELAKQVEPLEEVIDEMVEDLHQRHVYRMTHDLCDVFNGIHFQNILLNLERVSDQCSDLAVYMIGRADPSVIGNEHQYLRDLHHSNDEKYLSAFQSNYDKYFTKLNAINALKDEGYKDA
jgi:phosphate:Na+ symporter